MFIKSISLSFSTLITSFRAINHFQLLQQAQDTKNNLFILRTLQQKYCFSNFFRTISLKPNIKCLSPYQPLIDRYSHLSPLLLIGHYHQQTIFPTQLTLTVEELCSALPQKVPLSCREMSNFRARAVLENRLNIKLQELCLGGMMVVGEPIEMWDEVIQVILDYCPSPLIVPVLESFPSLPYSLTHVDFIRGVRQIHRHVKDAVKTHSPLVIEQFRQQQYVEWIKAKYNIQEIEWVESKGLIEML